MEVSGSKETMQNSDLDPVESEGVNDPENCGYRDCQTNQLRD